METVTLNEKAVKGMFENCKHQDSIILGLHKMVYKRAWKNIGKINGFCQCSKATSLAICKLCMTFDHIHHPNTMPGGAWLNWGFSTCHDIPLRNWEIIPAPYTS